MLYRGAFFKRIFASRLVLFLAACLALVFLVALTRAFLKDRSIQREIQALEAERTRLEQSKINLLGSLRNIKSDGFLEKEAREKFGLQQPGEKLVVVVDDKNKVARDPDQNELLKKVALEGNPTKWWRYFFASR